LRLPSIHILRVCLLWQFEIVFQSAIAFLPEALYVLAGISHFCKPPCLEQDRHCVRKRCSVFLLYTHFSIFFLHHASNCFVCLGNFEIIFPSAMQLSSKDNLGCFYISCSSANPCFEQGIIVQGKV
jgi:uncharacterized membrane protein